MSDAQREWVPFDEMRELPEIAKQGRADIIFGPDMFEPLLELEHPTVEEATHRAIAEGKLEDLGITEYPEGKTVGEVWPGLDAAEIAERGLEIARRLDLSPSEPPIKNGLLGKLLHLTS